VRSPSQKVTQRKTKPKKKKHHRKKEKKKKKKAPLKEPYNPSKKAFP
jgi:hypothetical protein